MRTFAALLVVAASACQLVLPIHEEEDGASPVDSGLDALDAPDAIDEPSTDAGPQNLLVNPTFAGASGVAPCGSPWAASNNSSAVTLALFDAGVCRVCGPKTLGLTQLVKNGDASAFTFNVGTSARIAAVPPQTLVHVLLQADVHLADGGRTFINAYAGVDQNGKVLIGSNGSDFVNGLSSIGFNVVPDDADGGCFLVSQPDLSLLP